MFTPTPNMPWQRISDLIPARSLIQTNQMSLICAIVKSPCINGHLVYYPPFHRNTYNRRYRPILAWFMLISSAPRCRRPTWDCVFLRPAPSWILRWLWPRCRVTTKNNQVDATYSEHSSWIKIVRPGTRTLMCLTMIWSWLMVTILFFCECTFHTGFQFILISIWVLLLSCVISILSVSLHFGEER